MAEFLARDCYDLWSLTVFSRVMATQSLLNLMRTDPLSHKRQSFLRQVLKLIHTSKGDRQRIYDLLQANQALLDRQFTEALTTWTTHKAQTARPEVAIDLAHLLCRWAELIAPWGEGNPQINCEIAIASYQAALNLFSQHSQHSQYSETQALLTELQNHYQTLPTDSPPSAPISKQTFPNSRDGIYLSHRVQERSYELLQWGGYALLLLTLLHSLEHFLTADWSSVPGRLELAHKLIDQVWMPLIGLILIFYRQEGYVSRPHLYWLRCLSWSSLGLASLYGILALLALGVSLQMNPSSPPNLRRAQAIPPFPSEALRNPVISPAAPALSFTDSPPLCTPLATACHRPLGLLQGFWGALSFGVIWRMTRWSRAFRG